MLKNKGFTLIEVAMVLIIGGVLLASLSAILSTYVKKTQIHTTKQRLDSIDEALQLFLSLNGRYPCVADLTAPLDTINFGVEMATCSAAPTLSGGRGGRVIHSGAIPVRTLNLPDDYIADGWNARFTYAVTELLTDVATYDRNEGGIFVVDSAGIDIVVSPAPGSAHYVLVSHGQNNSGATVISGSGTVPCGAPTVLESENCNADATFRKTLLLGTANTNNLYDDIISIRANSSFGEQIPPGAVLAFNNFTCPDGWIVFSSAVNRTVVGIGGAYALRDTGGSDTVSLTPAETGFSVFPTGVSLATLPAGPTNLVEDLGVAPTAHENRTPYIALRYCEKT